MKNLSLTLGLLILAIVILGVSVIRVSAQTQSENYQILPLVGETASSSAQENLGATQRVDYFLAYPGMLPDHPLYFLKMARDRVWLWLTPDPLKKAELLLLFADKRLGAGKALIEGNKIELGITTITKAEKYLERAVAQERVAAQKGKETTTFLEKLTQATLKHQEVLTELEEKVPESFKPTLNEAAGYAQRGYNQVKEILEK